MFTKIYSVLTLMINHLFYRKRYTLLCCLFSSSIESRCAHARNRPSVVFFLSQIILQKS